MSALKKDYARGNYRKTKTGHDDRSSYLSASGSINGLFPVPTANSKSIAKNKTPKLEKEYKKEGELTAFAEILSQEAKTKDMLIEILTERCTKAENENDNLYREKARLERELAAEKYNTEQKYHNDSSLEIDIENCKIEIDQLKKELTAEQKENQVKESQLLRLSSDLHKCRRESSQSLGEYRTQYQNSLHEIDDLKRRLSLLNQNIQKEKTKTTNFDDNIRTIQHEKDELSTKYEQTLEILHKEAEMRQKAESQLEEMDFKIKQLRKSSVSHLEKIERQELDRKRLTDAFQRQSNRIKELEALKKNAEDSHHDSSAKYKRSQKQIQNITKKNSFLEKKIIVKDEEVKVLEEEYKTLLESLEKLKKNHGALKQRFQYNNEVMKMKNRETTIHTSRQLNGQVKTESREEYDDTRVNIKQRSNKNNFIKTKKNAAVKAQAAVTDPARAFDSDAPEWMKY